MKQNKIWVGIVSIVVLATGSFAQQMVTNVVFNDTFNGDDNTNTVNANLDIRQSGTLGTVYYARAAVPGSLDGYYQILDGKLYHENGDPAAQIFMSTTPVQADANSRVNMYSHLAGKKYIIEATVTLFSSLSSASNANDIRLYFSDIASAGPNTQFMMRAQKIANVTRFYRTGISDPGDIVLGINGTDGMVKKLKLVVDESVSPVYYEYFLNDEMVYSCPAADIVELNSVGRYLFFQTTAGATATLDDVSVSVIEPLIDPFDEWMSQYNAGASTNRTDNPDADSLDNFGEWAFGGDPTNSADIGFVPESLLAEVDGINYLVYIYAKRTDAAELGLSYELVLKDALTEGSWANDGSYIEIPGEVIANGFATVTNAVPTTQDIRFVTVQVEEVDE